ncbi:TnsA endonuclease N-terminal domain-containing protein [Niallia alba]|uniref:TnsA endonuclease N-terminal domain-containing protein n=1 Tax=Niallia alba TaxID=2729105 RepID=A0A7Y0KBD3_9BACI|nr:TnsA endonuclease N-terminal domain-containing protein [Niallia alba]NMO79180.1 hypothetical protein [Niallia alba]
MEQVRKIKPSKKGSFRGFINSKKSNEMVAWESLLEKDFIKVLDFDPSIIKIQSQPIKIEYRYKGKIYKYFPDFLVETKDKQYIIFEVKPEDKIKEEDNKVKFEVGKIYCEKKGWKFKIVTEKDIRQGYLIQNLDKIRGVDERLTKESTKIKIYNFIQKNGKSKMEDIIKFDDSIPSPEIYSNLYYMIYNQQLNIDLINH